MAHIRQAFEIPGVTDMAVVLAQAEERARKKGEATKIHYHRFLDTCNDNCRIIWSEEKN